MKSKRKKCDLILYITPKLHLAPHIPKKFAIVLKVIGHYNVVTYKIKDVLISILVKKVYKDFYSYLVPIELYLNIIDIQYNKEKTFIEYQINIKKYKELSFIKLFDHLRSHCLSLKINISAIKISCYIFEKHIEYPRSKTLGFTRIPGYNKDDIYNEIDEVFKVALENFEYLILPSNFYSSNFIINHIVLRVYYNTPVSKDLLVIKPFVFYNYEYVLNSEIKLIKTRLKMTLINDLQEKDLTTQAFHNAGYITSDFDFIL